MKEELGRSGADAPSGCQPSASAAVPASSQSGIPNADRIRALPWRDMSDFPRDGAIYAVMFYPWRVRTNDPRIQFAQWLDLYGTGGKLCQPWDYDSEPFADGWLPLGELATLSASGMSAEGQDAQRLGAEPASPVREAETPNG